MVYNQPLSTSPATSFRQVIVSARLGGPPFILSVDDYKDMVRMVAEGNGEKDGNQPGNSELGIKRILDVLRGEGMAAGKLLPPRVPVGSDAVYSIREKCEENLRLVGEREALARGTDFDEPKRGRWATKE